MNRTRAVPPFAASCAPPLHHHHPHHHHHRQVHVWGRQVQVHVWGRKVQGQGQVRTPEQAHAYGQTAFVSSPCLKLQKITVCAHQSMRRVCTNKTTKIKTGAHTHSAHQSHDTAPGHWRQNGENCTNSSVVFCLFARCPPCLWTRTVATTRSECCRGT